MSSSTDWMKNIIRPHLWSLTPYSSARHEFSDEAEVWLDANENPYDKTHKRRNRYPEPLQPEVRTLASRYFECEENALFIGNGSDEAIDLLIRASCDPGSDQIVICPPTYGMYEVSAGIHNCKIARVPLLPSTFELDMDELLPVLAQPESKIFFLCSPNNPTGTLLEQKQIVRVLDEFSGWVVVDQAYFEFSTQDLAGEREIWKSLQSRYPKLVLLRTLSKAWGAAALRVGFAIGHPALIEVLNRIKPPYNISEPVQDEAIQILSRQDVVEKEVQVIISERDRLSVFLQELPMVQRVYPSSANFLLVEFEHADHVFRSLTEAGIVVRNRSKQVPDTLRITIGTPEENNRLLTELQRITSTK